MNTTANKAIAGGVAPAAIFVLSWVAQKFGGVEVPMEVQAAAAIVVSALAVYIVPNKAA